MADQDVCPHLDSIGEVTKEDLLQKSKVGFSYSKGAVKHVLSGLMALISA